MELPSRHLVSTVQPGNDLKVSAIVLNWKRPGNVRTILRYLEKRPFIDEILVWNNAAEEFIKPAWAGKTRVINSDQNLKDHAKYLACYEAKNSTCFYQDDDWHTAAYLDLLYKTFCLNPEHIHTVTSAAILAENLFWTYYNSDGIHAEFSWIGCGAMFPKKSATDFLALIEKRYNKVMRGLSDRAFSCLHNQPIVQIESPLYPLDQAEAFSAGESFSRDKATVIDSIHTELPSVAQPVHPPPTYRIRAINEQIALFSTLDPIDYRYRELEYQGKSEFEARDVANLKNESFNQFIRHSYVRALGPNPLTRWRALFSPGDQWGVLLNSPADTEISISTCAPAETSGRWRIEYEQKSMMYEFTTDSWLRINSLQKLKLTYCGEAPVNLKIKVRRCNP